MFSHPMFSHVALNPQVVAVLFDRAQLGISLFCLSLVIHIVEVPLDRLLCRGLGLELQVEAEEDD